MNTDTRSIKVVHIAKINGEGNLKAFIDVEYAGLIIKKCSVINGKRGLFVSMPRKVDNMGRWMDTVVPVSDDLREAFNDVILEAYEKEIA